MNVYLPLLCFIVLSLKALNTSTLCTVYQSLFILLCVQCVNLRCICIHLFGKLNVMFLVPSLITYTTCMYCIRETCHGGMRCFHLGDAVRCFLQKDLFACMCTLYAACISQSRESGGGNFEGVQSIEKC